MREAVDKTQDDLPFLFLRKSYADYEKAVVKCDDLLAKNPSDATAYYIRSMARFGMASLVPTKFIGDETVSEKRIDAVCRENADTFQKIRKRLSAEAQKDPNNKDHLISELTFGFWAYLFSSAYKKALWSKHPTLLKEIFDCTKETLVSGRVYERVNRIRMYRNKVFHYGSLITVTDALNEPARIHNMIYKLIRDMNANAVLKQIKEIDDFDEKYAKGRSLGYFR